MEILRIFPEEIQTAIETEIRDVDSIQEIRLRNNRKLIIKESQREIKLPLTITMSDIRKILEYVSRYSIYAYEDELKQGYITIEGGHRIGICGKIVMDTSTLSIKNINYISSINIRVAMEHKGIADYVLPAIIDGDNVCHTLIISPPCCGKTTLLRDIIRQLSDGSRFLAGIDVGVVDERSEIAASHLGTAYNDVGSRTDILDCCPKEIGMLMLIRSMSPKVIAVDEIGGIRDIEAIRYVINSGCRIIATVHGRTLSEVINKPYLGELIKDSTFERIITIGNDYKKNIYVNKNGKIMKINKNVG
ncbi:MAG: stage III sporulation protein AA [Lachnospiraceae bacterium]|nr:stage III sporulation protein AA [Lachnospiraceae bacterium]